MSRATMSVSFEHREQAAQTVGRDSNSKFIDFKTKFLADIETLKQHLLKVYSKAAFDCDELYELITTSFSNVQTRVDAVLYLNAIYSSEYYVIEHCMRVGLLANVFASWLELDAEATKTATVAGLLHDIGMLEVPRTIVEKKDALTPEERELINGHTLRGPLMLLNRGVNQDIRQAVRSHHERYDGSGYPDGLVGGDIGRLPSLISIIDVFDSMTSNRPYHPATCPFDVIDFLHKSMIDKFDPGLLYVFYNNIPDIYRNVLVKLSDGRRAYVIFINPNNKTRPIVQLERSKEFIDLSTRRDIKIASLL